MYQLFVVDSGLGEFIPFGDPSETMQDSFLVLRELDSEYAEWEKLDYASNIIRDGVPWPSEAVLLYEGCDVCLADRFGNIFDLVEDDDGLKRWE